MKSGLTVDLTPFRWCRERPSLKLRPTATHPYHTTPAMWLHPPWYPGDTTHHHLCFSPTLSVAQYLWQPVDHCHHLSTHSQGLGYNLVVPDSDPSGAGVGTKAGMGIDWSALKLNKGACNFEKLKVKHMFSMVDREPPTDVSWGPTDTGWGRINIGWGLTDIHRLQMRRVVPKGKNKNR